MDNNEEEGSWFTNQLVNIFTDKPENCEEIPRGELAKLLRDFGQVEEFRIREVFGNLFNATDKNQDGIVSCYGNLNKPIPN